MKLSQDTTAGGVNTTASQVAQWAYALRRLHARIAPLCSSRTPSAGSLVPVRQARVPSSAKMAGNWLNREDEPAPMACNACSEASSGIRMGYVTTCVPTCWSNWARRMPLW